ncbi:hypothetical protein KILIM_019_00680 [Kineosphaera limosa NBRC 100340]|uniref:Putative membrane protein insertion efficiency factor n=1 Tax=Kineosphaera limosa NBRC 100340 TaxID=1184609 RepID=K6X9C3_9MICO|nr:membrane protein insertion efficiency factor YidD [Kineosphaera limosa]GAB95414.1 hypothetical protein KILIM_019_00680 [Kineosphaera limosa NBRC 100340]
MSSEGGRESSGGTAAETARETLRRWGALPLVALVRGYQLFLSPLLPSTCRFYPSCSAYSLTALRRFGPITGTWLTIRRLGRCHPWNPGGVDHVPRRGADGRPIGRAQWVAPAVGGAPTRQNDHHVSDRHTGRDDDPAPADRPRHATDERRTG